MPILAGGREHARDCHIHVFDPARLRCRRAPNIPTGRLMQRWVGPSRTVIVTPKPYGTDNRSQWTPCLNSASTTPAGLSLCGPMSAHGTPVPAGFDDMPAHDLDRRRRRAWLGHSGLVQCAAASSRPKEQLMDRANSSRACTASATRLPIRRSSWIMPNSTARRACRVTCLDAAHQLRQRSSWTLSGLTKGLSVPNERRNSRFSPKYHWPGRSHSPSRIIDGWRSSPFWAI